MGETSVQAMGDTIENDISHRTNTPFRAKSTFCPPRYRNPSLETYCRLNRDKHWMIQKNYSTLILRNADKGGAVVLLNHNDYVNVIRGQVNNTTFFKLSRRGVALAQTYKGSRWTGIPCYAETASTLHPQKRASPSANTVAYAGFIVHRGTMTNKPTIWISVSGSGVTQRNGCMTEGIVIKI
ncbi:unnamed protein product [Coregonus sp. 'balchen']|nr:unnamed protein product [Coregonus sp. 'balchen']